MFLRVLAVVLAICAAGVAAGAFWWVRHPAAPDRVSAAGVPGLGQEGLTVRDAEVPGGAVATGLGNTPADPLRRGSERVPVRIYEPAGQPWGTLVWAHGGSFVRGSLDWPEADWAARAFAAAGLRVYSVDYVLATDGVHAPGPARDVAAVVAAVDAQYAEPVLLGGASAGAHLATEAAVMQRDLTAVGRLSALLLVYPTAHRVQLERPDIAQLTEQLPEQRRFSADRIAEMYANYVGTGGDAVPEVMVVGELAGDLLASLPATVVVHAEADDLRASGEQFTDQLRAVGVPVAELVVPETVHGFVNRPEESPRALADARATVEFFVSHARGWGDR